MVSGLVTSPCDQLRIFSGEASMMRIASKSVIGLVSSNGFERNKVTLLGGPFSSRRGISRDSFMGPSLPGKRRLPLSRRTTKNSLLPAQPLVSSHAVSQQSRPGHRSQDQSATAATSGTGTFLRRSARLMSSTSRHSDCNSRMSTLNDSGTPGSIAASPLTMAS